MAATYFGNSESETEERVFAMLDAGAGVQRIHREDLSGRARHIITDESIRPDGLLVFPDDEQFRCLRNRVFALEIKPDRIVCDHLKVISELTEQAKSYMDSRYEIPQLPGRSEVDGCIIYPNLDQILPQMPAGEQGARFSRNDDYKSGVRDMHRRVLARQRIFELVSMDTGFGILWCDEWLCRYENDRWRVSGKNHQFRRKVGSDYQ